METELNSTAYLLKLGFYPQHYGFGYLAQAISTVAANPKGYYSRSIDIFEVLKRDFGVQRSKASRCMHYSISIAWESPANTELHQLFPQCKRDFPPAVTEFICRIAVELGAFGSRGFIGQITDGASQSVPIA